jgi:hypothetical protein
MPDGPSDQTQTIDLMDAIGCHKNHSTGDLLKAKKSNEIFPDSAYDKQ